MQPLAQRELNGLQMVRQRKRREEVTFDIDVAPEIRLGQAQRIAAQHHRTNEARVVANQRERRMGRMHRRVAQPQDGAVPKAERQTPGEPAEHLVQQACGVMSVMSVRRRREPPIHIGCMPR